MSECYCGTMMDDRECDHCLVTTLRKRVGELEEQVADYCNDAEAWRELYQKEAVEINIVGPDEAKKLADYVNKELQARVEELEAQLLESADSGWHNLRNQRDDLLKRVDELEEAVEGGGLGCCEYAKGVISNERDRYLKALEEIRELKQNCQWPMSGKTNTPCVEEGVNHPWTCEYCITSTALKPCDPIE